MLEFLQGKKTYLVMVLAIGGIGMGWLNGEMNAAEAINAGLMALGLGTLRAGVSKV